MASASDFIARGKVIGTKDGKVIFAPSDSNYELYLETASPYAGPVGQLIDARVKIKARKVYTVPSGGGFISPIFGPPKTLQGRALFVDESTVVIRAGLPIIVELPKPDDALDLEAGPIQAGRIVNVAALPGASFELVSSASVESGQKP